MTNYNKLIELATELRTRSIKLDNRYTKAESARIRKAITEMKKIATAAKRELIEADKER